MNNIEYLGKKLQVIIDRPINSLHPKYKFKYEVNYGYIPNTTSGDGEEIDCYILGVNKAIREFEGVCIAIIHRLDDNDDKLIIVKDNMEFSDEEIEKLTNFQEKWFKHIILRK